MLRWGIWVGGSLVEGRTGRRCQSKKQQISEQEGSGHGWAKKEAVCQSEPNSISELPELGCLALSSGCG